MVIIKNIYDKVLRLLETTPGQAIKEMSIQLKLNRTFLAGYLKALEDMKYLTSRKVGPARIYFKNTIARENQNTNEKY